MKRKPTVYDMKVMWDSLVVPTACAVGKALRAGGFQISDRAIQRAAKKGFPEPAGKTIDSRGTKMVKAGIDKIARDKISSEQKPLEEQLRASMEERTEERAGRGSELMRQSIAENRAILNNMGLVAAILVAEEMLALIDRLILEPDKVARLLTAITEATQKRYDVLEVLPPLEEAQLITELRRLPAPEMIDVTPNTDDVAEKIARFRRSAGIVD